MLMTDSLEPRGSEAALFDQVKEGINNLRGKL
jgi:hypothetical protein